MRYHRTFGLDAGQLNELEARIEDILPDPWDKGRGRPKSLSLREAIGMLAGAYQPLCATGNVSPAKIGSMPRRDTAVSRDVLDRFAERLVRLLNWRSAEAGAGRCVDLIAAGGVAAG